MNTCNPSDSSVSIRASQTEQRPTAQTAPNTAAWLQICVKQELMSRSALRAAVVHKTTAGLCRRALHNVLVDVNQHRYSQLLVKSHLAARDQPHAHHTHHAGRLESHVNGVGVPLAAEQLVRMELHSVRHRPVLGKRPAGRHCSKIMHRAPWKNPVRKCCCILHCSYLQQRMCSALHDGQKGGKHPCRLHGRRRCTPHFFHTHFRTHAPEPCQRQHNMATMLCCIRTHPWCVNGAWARSNRFSISSPCSTGTSS